MKVSAPGRALIEQREGKKLRAYRDSVGVLTIGVGHTGRMAGPPVTAGMTITEAECDAFLAADLAPVEAVLGAKVKVPVSQNETDAMASLGFNIGTGGLAKSTMVKRLNLGDVPGAADAFLMWAKPAELIGRRRAERLQFLQADPVTTRARAGVLATHAAKASATAKKASAAAAAAPSVGVVAAGLAAAHHPAVAASVGLATLLFSGASSLLGWLQGHKAQTLAANAAAHLG